MTDDRFIFKGPDEPGAKRLAPLRRVNPRYTARARAEAEAAAIAAEAEVQAKEAVVAAITDLRREPPRNEREKLRLLMRMANHPKIGVQKAFRIAEELGWGDE